MGDEIRRSISINDGRGEIGGDGNGNLEGHFPSEWGEGGNNKGNQRLEGRSPSVFEGGGYEG